MAMMILLCRLYVAGSYTMAADGDKVRLTHNLVSYAHDEMSIIEHTVQ